MVQKIILAPDSYKGSLSAIQVCNTLEKAAKKYIPDVECIKLPVADGGEGLVDAMLMACGGKQIQAKVQDPIGREINAKYGILNDGTAVIEMAAASGLPLLKAHERNPMDTSTYGTGQLILDALGKGCRKIILGLGGSATNDAGIGAAAALGFRFQSMPDQVSLDGKGLSKITAIDTSQVVPELKQCTIQIACDVKNPLHGPNGAAAIYSPQKGATADMVNLLDEGLKNIAEVIRGQFGLNVRDIPGSGAAGGMAIPFLILGIAQLKSGVDLVLDAMNFESCLSGCHLVVTGEGRTDHQSAMGKVLSGISRRAKKAGVPVVALSGAVEDGSEALYQEGMTALFSACRTIMPLEEALSEAEKNLYGAASDLFRLIEAVSR